MTGEPRAANREPRTLFLAWVLRIIGVAIVFVFTAAPLPGDTPGCESETGVDESAAIGDDPTLRRVLCAPHCYNDCDVLIRCGRYTEPNRATCYTDCLNPRGCVTGMANTMTFDALCPIADYGPNRVITENEVKACVDDAAAQGCWCSAGLDCFSSAVDSVPLNCTAGQLCDPR